MPRARKSVPPAPATSQSAPPPSTKAVPAKKARSRKTAAKVIQPVTTAAAVTPAATVIPAATVTPVVPPIKVEVEVEAVVGDIVAAATEVVVPEEIPPQAVLVDDFAELTASIQLVQQACSAIRARVRALEKRAARELKNALKLGAKRRRRQGNRQPSGFVKPALISNELAAFLGKEKGTEMARTAVTREINSYIRSNDLQDKANGRKINPDPSLKALLQLTDADELTYFNLQKYMSPHFHKAKPSPAT
jgi:hypothetical protein